MRIMMTQSTQPDNKCNICPRRCNIDRTHNKGYCLMNDKIMAARAALHMWEEPCISGERGSGAIFFSGCTLRCVFCQNHDIASAKAGSFNAVLYECALMVLISSLPSGNASSSLLCPRSEIVFNFNMYKRNDNFPQSTLRYRLSHGKVF